MTRRRPRRAFRARQSLALATMLAVGALLGLGLGHWLGAPQRPPGLAPPAAKPSVAAPAPALLPAPGPEVGPVVVAAPALPVEIAALPPMVPLPPALQAWRRYAVAVPPSEGRPILAVVIDDMGMQPKRLAAIAGLPAPLTFAFLPYGSDLPAQVAQVRARGHEVLLHLPMEAVDAHEDPGPNALKIGLDRAETERRLTWSLERFGGYVGVNNHMGSRYTRDAAHMVPVLQALKARGLLFLDSRTTADSVAAGEALRLGVPVASRDVFLDYDTASDRVRAELDRAEALARNRGMAIAIGHPHESTLAVLADRLPGMAGRGVLLVPISAVVARRLGD